MDTATRTRIEMLLRGVTTPQLARRAGVSRVHAWRWGTGKPGVSEEAAARLHRALYESDGARAATAK